MDRSAQPNPPKNGPGEMQCRSLGRAGLSVSVVGFGASPLGSVFREVDPAECDRAVRYAIDEGINFFDVSPYYGLTLAEERLGRALEGRRHEVVLAAKCGRYGRGEFDFSPRRIRASLEESLARLRTDRIDLFQAHDIEFGDLDRIIDETIPAMRRLQEEGKVRSIGITGYPLNALRRVAEAAPVDTILSYCRYNLLIDDLDNRLMPFADQHGIRVINASGLHMGILTEGGAPDWHPAPASVREAGRQAAELCRRHGADISTIALRFCFEYQRVASTLVGMSSVEHVRRNLEAYRSTIDEELLRELKTLLKPVANLVWPSGRPENGDRPSAPVSAESVSAR